MKMYVQGVIDEIFVRTKSTIKSEIENETEDFILNVNVEEYIEHLVSNHVIDFPILRFEEVTADSVERQIPSEDFPYAYHPTPGKTYKKDVIRFHIPYSGSISILTYRPASRFTMNGGLPIKTLGNALVFEYINFDNNPEKIKQNYDQEINRMMSNYNYLKDDCRKFNLELESFARTALQQRKNSHLKKKDILSALGVPIKKRKDAPKTFSVPAPKLRRKINIKPIVHVKSHEPEPTLDEKTYFDILSIIQDVGLNFEKYPSTYAKKGEEDLRDHILLILQPNFENISVTGETFNKKGKTDILLRHESNNVFIGECKIWKGEKQLHKTIDQLLSYSTWRDTKAAIIFFVSNLGISQVLESVKSNTPKHTNFIREKKHTKENWFNYIMHLNGDLSRELNVAIMLFHIPKNDKSR